MKFDNYNPQEFEPEILKFWQKKEIVDTLRKRNQKGKSFYFLQGPPYTSGRVHLGTAWQTSMKDIVLRYKRMNGFNVWDRMGYDMHGLPTEQKVMTKLNLKNKEDIEKFGVAKFTRECNKFCIEMMKKMDEDFIRLGITLDFRDPYQPIKKEFMEAEWWLIKQAHNKGRLYQGLRTMHWDAATQTAVAKHELEYKNVTDTSIYVKFAYKDNPKKFFIIWTTTPWTIPLNLAIMVNPELTYVEVSVGNETWLLAESLVKTVMEKAGENKYKIKKKIKGKILEGQSYIHPLGILKFLPEELQKNPKLFTVLLSKEYVDDSAGTGLVHSAPGCGPEDYEVGHRNGIPPFNCVNEEGYFENFGEFSFWRAKIDDKKFIQAIDDSGHLLASEPYLHEYPYGERSHQPVIFRTTKQWFFKVEDLKSKMVAANKKICWNPEAAKNAFNSWLENLRDNSITKQRYWGTPVPIWQAEDGDYIVVENVKELEKLSGEKVQGMHIPEIDKITIKKDGKLYKRIPDVLDVWIDAGTASWNCLNYPSDKKLFNKFFPADFILEGKDQIRGWFNLLMVASFLGFDKPSFNNVYMNGFVTDVGGVKMSKSLGNIISPYEVIDKHSADVLRYYMFQTNAGEDINFSWDECKTKSRNLLVLWNMHKFLINLAKESQVNPYELNVKSFGIEEKYILSRLNSTIKKVTELLDKYKLDEIIAPLEDLYLELSRTYIQMVRDKAALGSKEEKKVCIYTIGKVLLELVKMFGIVAPFISEMIYLNLKQEYGLKEESISHYLWPKVDGKIDSKLELQVQTLQNLIQAALFTREKAKLGLRWPVKEIMVVSSDLEVKKTVERLNGIICKQTNSKLVFTASSMKEMQVKIKPDFSKIGPVYGKLSPQIIAKISSENPEVIMDKIQKSGSYQFKLGKEVIKIDQNMLVIEREAPVNYELAEFKDGYVFLNTERDDELELEGYSREVMRNVQSLRKKAGLKKWDRVNLLLVSKLSLEKYKSEISEKVGADSLEFFEKEPTRKYQHLGAFTVKEVEFSAYFDTVQE